jgi:hypothetical protein
MFRMDMAVGGVGVGEGCLEKTQPAVAPALMTPAETSHQDGSLSEIS